MRFYEFLIIGSNGLLGSNIVSLLKKKKSLNTKLLQEIIQILI